MRPRPISPRAVCAGAFGPSESADRASADRASAGLAVHKGAGACVGSFSLPGSRRDVAPVKSLLRSLGQVRFVERDWLFLLARFVLKESNRALFLCFVAFCFD